MPFTSKSPTYLTPEQRDVLTQIPADLSDREIARHYTLTQKDLELLNQRRRHHNRLGFAVQLAMLRFPGRPLRELAGVPPRVLAAIADQVQVPASAFSRYGDRDHTLYEQELTATVTSAKTLLRPDDGDTLDLIEARYVPMRQSLLSLYRVLDWSPVRATEPALQALEHVSQMAEHRKRVTAPTQSIGKEKVVAPLGHLTERWRKHALVGEDIAPTFYEAAAFDALKGRVRSGDVAVNGSRRYRTFEGYLLPQRAFDQLVQKQQTRLAVANEADAYLAEKQQEIRDGLRALQESIGKIEGSLVLDEKGQLHLPPLEKAIPAEVERMRGRVYGMLPQVKLPELLLEVDNWTGFLRPFTHLTSGDAPVGDEKLVLVAALMGMGMNLGLTKMEQSCPYTYRQLSWSVDWYIREETLLASLARLDNFVLEAPLSRHWGDGTTSSSDGMRMAIGVKAANAEYNAKHFGPRRGANMYIHAADIWVPFGKPQIIGTNEEALYVIDALCHHESDLHIREHYTDTGGSTEETSSNNT